MHLVRCFLLSLKESLYDYGICVLVCSGKVQHAQLLGRTPCTSSASEGELNQVCSWCQSAIPFVVSGYTQKGKHYLHPTLVIPSAHTSEHANQVLWPFVRLIIGSQGNHSCSCGQGMLLEFVMICYQDQPNLSHTRIKANL
jgi:hypothetical protein